VRLLPNSQAAGRFHKWVDLAIERDLERIRGPEAYEPIQKDRSISRSGANNRKRGGGESRAAICHQKVLRKRMDGAILLTRIMERGSAFVPNGVGGAE